MSINFVCGWECRINIAGGAAVPSANHWHSPATGPTISTSTVRTGTASLRINTAGGTQYLGRTVAQNIVAGRVYIRFAAIPSATTHIIGNVNANGSGNIRITNTGQITVQAGAGSTVNVGSPLSQDVWYRIDWLFNTSTGTASLKARIDGGAEAESTVSQASANTTAVRFGFQVANTGDAFYDDLVLGNAAGDYPIGSGIVERLKPNSDGTHSFTAGDFGYNTAGGDVATSATDVYTYVDDDDLTSVADLIRQKVVRSTGYVEVGFENPVTTTDAQAVTVISSWHASATGANTVGLKLNDGGTLLAVTDDAGDDLSDFSNTAVTFDSQTYTSPPTGGAWTNSKLQNIKVRAGYSTDVVGIPYWDGVMLEVAFAVAETATQYGQAQASIILKQNSYGQAQALVNGTYTQVIDTFTRSVSDDWGNADTGGTWVRISGTAADVDVNGSEGTIQANSKVLNLPNVILGRESGVGHRLRFKLSAIPDATTSIFWFNFGAGTADTNLVGFYQTIRYDLGANQLQVRTGINGSTTGTYATLTNPQANTWYILETTHVRSSNGDIRARSKIYAEGSTPTAYVNNSLLAGIVYPGHLTLSVPIVSGTIQPLISFDDINTKDAGWTESGQAQASIIIIGRGYGQAQAVMSTKRIHAQGHATLNQMQWTGFAQAKLLSFDFNRHAQAQGQIGQLKRTGLASALITKPIVNAQAVAMIDTGIYSSTTSFNVDSISGFGFTDEGLKWEIEPADNNDNFVQVSGGKGIIKNAHLLITNSTPDPTYLYRVFTKAQFQITGSIAFKELKTSLITAGTIAGVSFGGQRNPPFTTGFGVAIRIGVTINNEIAINSAFQSEPVLTGYTYDPSKTYNFIIQFNSPKKSEVGVTKNIFVRVKVWDASENEPTTWLINSAYDLAAPGSAANTNNSPGGVPGIQFSTLSGSNAPFRIEIDNYTFSSIGWYELGQAQAFITSGNFAHGQAQANIKQTYVQHGQSQAIILTTYYLHGQAQSWIEQTYVVHGQSQASIEATYNSFGQAQATIEQTYSQHGQSQGQIKQTYYQHAQAQSQIKQVYRNFGQTQARIKQTYFGLGQAQALISGSTVVHGQSQAWIENTYFGLGQSQATIKQTYFGLGQAQAWIEQTYFSLGQAQAQIKTTYFAHGQAQADILTTYYVQGQAQAQIKQTYVQHGQAQADILQVYWSHGQVNAWIEQTYYGFGQAQGTIKTTYFQHGQANADILQTYTDATGQAQAWIKTFANNVHAQAQAWIETTYYAHAQAQGKINAFDVNVHGQAQGNIKAEGNFAHGQSQAKINAFDFNQHGQAQGTIEQTYNQYGQSQADILQTYYQHGQSQGAIKTTYYQHGQANASILQTYVVHAQATAWIENTYYGHGQSEALIKNTYYGHGQTNAKINAFDVNVHAQAQAYIIQPGTTAHGQSQGYIKAIDVNAYGQAQGWIETTTSQHGQAQANIKQIYFASGQANAYIYRTEFGHGQAQADIKQIYYQHGQSQAWILTTSNAYGQSQGLIKNIYFGSGQAEAYIILLRYGSGQAQALVRVTQNVHGQSQAVVLNTYYGTGQAQSTIRTTINSSGQAQSWIEATITQSGQAQAQITSGTMAHGQAEAFIFRPEAFGQAQALVVTTHTLKTLELSDDNPIILTLEDEAVITELEDETEETVEIEDELSISVLLEDDALLTITLDDEAF